MGFWKWLLLSGKRAALTRIGKVYLATSIPLWVWVAWAPLKPALLGVLVWVAFWLLFGAHEYYSECVKKKETKP